MLNGEILREDEPMKVLKQCYNGTKYEWLFLGEFTDRVHTFDSASMPSVSVWPETEIVASGETATKILNTLITIINQTVECIESSKDMPHYQSLMRYFDAHVPLMCAFEDEGSIVGKLTDKKAIELAEAYKPQPHESMHEGALPDVISELMKCTYWNETKTKMQPVVHLLCKALPQRCQIRNLREIISNYCKQDDKVYDFMSKTVLCSILGAYEHSKTILSWKARIVVLRRFVYSPPNRTQMQVFLFGGYQHFLFYVIKEFLTYSIRLIPSLFEEIRETYKWDIFEKCVRSAMDSMRTTLEDNIVNNGAKLIQAWLKHAEPMLMNINKQQLGNLFRPQRLTFTQTILNMCERLDEANNQAKPYVCFSREYRDLMRTMAKRVERRHDVPVEWLKYFNVKKEAIETLKNIQKHYHQNAFRADVKKLLNDVTRYEFEAIRELFKIFWQVHHQVRVFPLPKHYYIAQIRALRRRYEIPEGVPMGDNVGTVYACLACHTFKAFVVKPTDKVTNLFANGHHKVIIDDETLKCYCGRRSDQNDSKKRPRVAIQEFMGESGAEAEENGKRARKKSWKMRRKKFMNDECAQTECLKFNMTGCLFQFYGVLYLFCPLCASPTIYDPQQHGPHGLHCGQCMKDGQFYTRVSCVICGSLRGAAKWDTISYIDDSKEGVQKERSGVICQGCDRPWIHSEGAPYVLSVLKTRCSRV